jgi:nucleoside-diphosphate-sugar epimerase
MRVLITGAAGNLGSFLSQYLMSSSHLLSLLVHKTPLPFQYTESLNVTVFTADLADPGTLYPACQDVDCIVHFAGVLFKPFPERFLPITNLVYFKNLIHVAGETGAKKIILISFPHVEGESTPEHPAQGRLSGQPTSIHAQTRLEAECHLFQKAEEFGYVPIVLRPGMIYGKGVLMIEGARWLMSRGLLGIWPQPTWVHLISLPDFLSAVTAAIENAQVTGVYNLGDDEPITLQAFIDRFASQFGFPKPWRAPRCLFPIAGRMTEVGAWLLNKPAPLTYDFIRIGMVSYVSNTERMKRDLLPDLAYPSINHGLELL